MTAFGIGFVLAFLVSLAALLIRRKHRAIPDTITLANASDVVSFRVGERYVFGDGQGTRTATITGVNRNKGTFTVSSGLVGDRRIELV